MRISESDLSPWLVAAMLFLGRVATADTPVWDNMTGQPSTAWAIPNNIGVPVGSGNRQMGIPATLADPASLTLTGFDICWVNNTGEPVTIDATHRLRLNYWVWNTVTFSASGTPAFSNPAGSGSIILAPAAPIALANNTFTQFQAVAPPASSLGMAGTFPGIAITPITVISTGPIGFAFNWEFDNGTGAFAQVSGSTSLIIGGATAVPTALGTNAFAAPNFGYYRSPHWDTVDNNGNFDAASGRQIGVNTSLAIRVYAASTPVNSCCNNTNGTCIATTVSSCAPDSTFIVGVSCSTNPCSPAGACCNPAGTCTISVAAACQSGSYQGDATVCLPNPCTPAMYLVSVVSIGTGRGTVVSTPGGIACPTACSSPYSHGTNLGLSATPALNSVFVGWTGGCTGAGSCSIILTGPAVVNAEFRCKADFNGLGVLDITDVFDFLTSWFALDPRADFDPNGILEVFDIVSFLHSWFAGC